MGVKRGAVRAPVAVNFPFRRARFWLQRHEWQSHSLSFRGIEKGDRWRGTFCSFILPRDSGEGGPSEREAIGWWKGRRPRRILLRRKCSGESEAPSTTLRVVPLPRYRGGGRKRVPFSRCAFCSRPEFCQSYSRNGPPQRREAERRKARRQQPRHTLGCCHPRMLRARRAPRTIRLHEPSACGRARLSALRRGSRRRANHARLGPGRASRDESAEALPSPFASRLSQAPGSPVVMPAGTMPGPPGNGLRDRPREPHSLHLQDRIRNVPFDERAECLLVQRAARDQQISAGCVISLI
jgi:hypothetical protein